MCIHDHEKPSSPCIVGRIPSTKVSWSLNYVQHEWLDSSLFSTSARFQKYDTKSSSFNHSFLVSRKKYRLPKSFNMHIILLTSNHSSTLCKRVKPMDTV